MFPWLSKYRWVGDFRNFFQALVLVALLLIVLVAVSMGRIDAPFLYRAGG